MTFVKVRVVMTNHKNEAANVAFAEFHVARTNHIEMKQLMRLMLGSMCL